MSDWNLFVKNHYNSPSLSGLSSGNKMKVLSQVYATLDKPASPKKSYYKPKGPIRNQLMKMERKESPLFEMGGSFCKGKPQKDCSRIPGCNWITPRGKSPYCSLSQSTGSSRTAKKYDPQRLATISALDKAVSKELLRSVQEELSELSEQKKQGRKNAQDLTSLLEEVVGPRKAKSDIVSLIKSTVPRRTLNWEQAADERLSKLTDVDELLGMD